jgi:hypothetical protein
MQRDISPGWRPATSAARLLEPFGFGDRDIMIDVDGAAALIRNVTFASRPCTFKL